MFVSDMTAKQIMETEEYKEGKEAKKKGLPLESNPYSRFTNEGQLYFYGWCDN